jgi:hypothetical protein
MLDNTHTYQSFINFNGGYIQQFSFPAIKDTGKSLVGSLNNELDRPKAFIIYADYFNKWFVGLIQPPAHPSPLTLQILPDQRPDQVPGLVRPFTNPDKAVGAAEAPATPVSPSTASTSALQSSPTFFPSPVA